MTDIAELGLKVRSDGVVVATDRLKKLGTQAATAESMVGKLTTAALKMVAAYATWRVAEATVSKFVSATVAAEHAQRRLETVVRSTGGAAGLTAKELGRMAEGLQRVTSFGDETIKSAQAILLGYGRIGREVFPAVTEAAMNMSAALGLDLVQAAERVGKAIDLPSRGMAALADQGFFFTGEQKKLVKQLEASGRIMEAQKIVLSELEFAYGGAARAARGTLGGALTALGEAFDDLFEANGPASEKLRQNVERLISTITDPAFISGVQSVGIAMFDAFNGALQAIRDIIFEVQKFFAQKYDKGLTSFYDTGSMEGAKERVGDLLSRGRGHMATDKNFGDMSDFFRPFQASGIGEGAGSFGGMLQTMGMGPSGSIGSSGGAGKAAEEYDKLVASAQARIDQLAVEAAATNLTAFEAAALEEKQRLIAEAAKADIELSPERMAQIEALSVAYADMTLTLEGLQMQLENRSPWETMTTEMERVQELLDRGKIGWDDYAAGVGRAVGEMVSSYANGATNVLDNIEKLTDAMGLQGKEAFEVQKTLSLARAVVAGGEAIVNSFNAGTAIGGPPVGFAFAGIAAAATAAQIASIASSTYQSKTVPKAGGAGAAAPAPIAQQQQSQTAVNVTLKGGGLYSRDNIQELFGAINDALGDGFKLNLQGA